MENSLKGRAFYREERFDKTKAALPEPFKNIEKISMRDNYFFNSGYQARKELEYALMKPMQTQTTTEDSYPNFAAAKIRTPARIMVLLAYYVAPESAHNQYYVTDSPVAKETIQDFLYSMLLQPVIHPSDSRNRYYEITDRGIALVKMLLDTPYPLKREITAPRTDEYYIDPRTRTRINLDP